MGKETKEKKNALSLQLFTFYHKGFWLGEQV